MAWRGCVVECGGLGSAWPVYLFSGLVLGSALPLLHILGLLPAVPGLSLAGSVLAHLPLFWPILAAYGLVTLLPLLPCSLTYPGCPWPILWLPAGLSLCYLWPVPFQVPYLFSGLLPGFSLAIHGLPCPAPSIPGAPPRDLPCTWGAVLAVVVRCHLVSIPMGAVCYLLVLYLLCTLVPCLSPCLPACRLCNGVPPRSSVPVCEGTLIHPGRFPRACCPIGTGPKPCFIVLCFI